MRKLLSIVVPRYKETEKEIFPLLSSIQGQAGIVFSDIEVIVANDGKHETIPLNEEFLTWFDFEIKQITCEVNRGCGPARQAGFDIADGEYVMCCDADDILHNVGVLGVIMQELLKNKPDFLNTSWLEEFKDTNGQYHYITHENDNTWMHGKIYRRHFLTEHNIRFPDFLRVQEDSYFNSLVSAHTSKSIYLPVTTYVWKFNPKSTTRCKNGIYTFETFPDFIYSCTLSYYKIPKNLLEDRVLHLIAYIYFYLHQAQWQEEKQRDYLRKSEMAFVKYITPFWDYWRNAAPQKISEAYNQERVKNFNGCIENETVWKWIERLGLAK